MEQKKFVLSNNASVILEYVLIFFLFFNKLWNDSRLKQLKFYVYRVYKKFNFKDNKIIQLMIKNNK